MHGSVGVLILRPRNNFPEILLDTLLDDPALVVLSLNYWLTKFVIGGVHGGRLVFGPTWVALVVKGGDVRVGFVHPFISSPLGRPSHWEEASTASGDTVAVAVACDTSLVGEVVLRVSIPSSGTKSSIL